MFDLGLNQFGIHRWFFPLGLALLASCSLDALKDRSSYVQEKEPPVNSYLMIPTAVWNRIEKSYNSIQIDQKDKLTDIKVTFFPMTVHLSEKTSGVLGGDNFTLPIPEGGALVNLARYVEKGKRTFNLEFRMEKELPETAKVFFVPHYLPQKIAGKVYGLNCNQALDITSFFKESMVKKGLALNTTNWRYLNVIGGTFVFYYFQPFDIYMSQVTFHDSRREDILCEHAEEAKAY